MFLVYPMHLLSRPDVFLINYAKIIFTESKFCKNIKSNVVNKTTDLVTLTNDIYPISSSEVFFKIK